LTLSHTNHHQPSGKKHQRFEANGTLPGCIGNGSVFNLGPWKVVRKKDFFVKRAMVFDKRAKPHHQQA